MKYTNWRKNRKGADTRGRRRSLAGVLAAAFLGLLFPGAAAPEDFTPASGTDTVGLQRLEDQAADLVKLQLEIGAERARAQEIAEDSERQRELMEQQKAVLTERLASLEERVEVFEERENRLQTRRETGEKELIRWRAAVETAGGVLDRFPQPGPASENPPDTLPDFSPGATNGAATAWKVQQAFARLDGVHAFSETFSVSKEGIETPDGARRKCNVLFAGYAQAFALAPDNESAWIGTLSPDRWVWRPANGAIPGIVRALRILRRRASPEILDLPFSAQGNEEPAQ